MSRALSVVVVLCALFGTSCIPTFEKCRFATVEGMQGPISAACSAEFCFQDLDGDGWYRAQEARVRAWSDDESEPEAVDCAGRLEVAEGTASADQPHFGDCDDDHNNRFPGNLEVCDNVDNDCNLHKDFDNEDEVDRDGLPRCARSKSVRLFLAGGSVLQEQTFDASSSALTVALGAAITGEVRLRTVIPDEVTDVAMVVVASWESDHAGPGLEVILAGTPDDELLSGTATLPFGPADDQVSFELSTMPAGLETVSLIIAVASLGPVGSAEHLASLTWPRWCCETQECAGTDPLPCPPVWDHPSLDLDPEPEPPVPGELKQRRQQDLASLDALDLASCQTLGVTRLSFMRGVTGEGGVPCANPLDLECQQIHVAMADAGCVEITLDIESEDDR